jgi:GNAT superfamily N-acetyltransferase
LIEAVYYFVNETLTLKPELHDVKGWPPGQAEKYTPILEACHDDGGWLYGLFDSQKQVGVAVLESRFIGKGKDHLQLKLLHISSSYRDKGFGQQLFNLAASEARQRGAKSLYISATPSEHTINFYLRLGCKFVRTRSGVVRIGTRRYSSRIPSRAERRMSCAPRDSGDRPSRSCWAASAGAR